MISKNISSKVFGRLVLQFKDPRSNNSIVLRYCGDSGMHDNNGRYVQIPTLHAHDLLIDAIRKVGVHDISGSTSSRDLRTTRSFLAYTPVYRPDDAIILDNGDDNHAKNISAMNAFIASEKLKKQDGDIVGVHSSLLLRITLLGNTDPNLVYMTYIYPDYLKTTKREMLSYHSSRSDGKENCASSCT